MTSIMVLLHLAMDHPVETIGFLIFSFWIWHSAAGPDIGASR